VALAKHMAHNVTCTSIPDHEDLGAFQLLLPHLGCSPPPCCEPDEDPIQDQSLAEVRNN
jgi:hypothetical protein